MSNANNANNYNNTNFVLCDGESAVTVDKNSDIAKSLVGLPWFGEIDFLQVNPVSLALGQAGYTKYPHLIVVGQSGLTFGFRKGVGYVRVKGMVSEMFDQDIDLPKYPQ